MQASEAYPVIMSSETHRRVPIGRWTWAILGAALCLLGWGVGGGPFLWAASQPEPAPGAGHQVATFAGGCFWCMEPPFEKLEGVVSVVSGYTGGPQKSPSYKQVAAGKTGHAEAVRVTYDPSRVTYDQLLDVFWRQIDPTDAGGQFADRGSQYRTGIFTHDAEQKKKAEASKKRRPFSSARHRG